MKQPQLFQKLMLLLSLLLLSSLAFSQVTEQWVKVMSGGRTPPSLAVDASGNVYVTGEYLTIDGSWPDTYETSVYSTVKFDAAGNTLWSRDYTGGEYFDYAYALSVDASENVYVTGDSNGDYATIKYDAAGNELWVRRYNSPENGYDAGYSLVVDSSGNVYVMGSSATIKYDASGNELWVKKHDGDSATLVAVDVSGNVYVTESGTITKYNMAGTVLWELSNSGRLQAVDVSGNVYVTEGDTVTKYNMAGTVLWELSSDSGSVVKVDASSNVYVIGDGGITKYNAAGNKLWFKSYSGARVAVDASGNLYLTWDSDYVFTTIKYDTDGVEQWVKKYNGPTSEPDFINVTNYAPSLVVDGSGNVYVTGITLVVDTDNGRHDYRYATIKYSQNQSLTVSSFTLINADSDQDVRELNDGDTINLAALTTLNLNIRANTNPGTIGSVVFKLNGAEARTHTESISPYALFADNNKGDYYPWTPNNGKYTLTATPYSGAKGSGTKGTPLTIHLTVTGKVVSSLILVNAVTDQDIKTLKNGDVIDLSALPTRKLNIRAVVHPDTVGSVVFNMDNKVIVRENLAPYAIGGDIKGNFRYWTLPTGKHTLTATPYSLTYGRGAKGKAHSVSFTVVDMAALTQATNADKAITDGSQNREQSLRATPNPFSIQTSIAFSVPKSGYTTVQVYDAKGIVVARLYEAWAEAGKEYRVRFESRQLHSGVYILSVATGKQVQSGKLVLIR
jgi:hypothetical protein